MRKIQVRIIDKDINGLFVGNEYTGLEYTKKDMGLMVDDLLATYKSLSLASSATKNRDEILTELIQKTLVRCYSSRPLEGGPLTPEEVREAVRIVQKSCRKGWF